MCLTQGPQRSDAGEAPARGPSASSQALYHLATALPSRYLRFTGLPKKRQGATRNDTKRQETFKQFLMHKMSKCD